MACGDEDRYVEMKIGVFSSVAAVIGLLVFAVPADACSRGSVAGANRMIVPERGINAALLDAAVLVEVNYYRCRAGLSRLRPEKRLRNVASGHSKWMARTQNVTHTSTAFGSGTLKGRMKRTGLKWRAGAENIGKIYRFQLGNRRFFVRDGATCQFTTVGGALISQHSYQSLARYVVGLWVDSPGHRKNIMDRRMTMVGTAIALDKKAKYCGTYYITQTFAG